MGFPNTGNSSIVRILKNPLYAGLVRVTATDKEPERYVKGLHEAIITEEQFWRAQQLLEDNKRIEKMRLKEEFPLKSILKSPCCGGSMTAGWTKGKLKYYLYYRCIKHSTVNIPGQLLHQQFDSLLESLNFTEDQVKELTRLVKDGLKKAAELRAKQLKVKQELFAAAEAKVERTEQKFMNDEINADTYKKWITRHQAERARLHSEIELLKDNVEGRVSEQLKLLPALLDLRVIFQKATISQQHSIIRAVFKDGLTFRDRAFRTPSINPAFEGNLLKMNEKGVLHLEHPSYQKDIIPYCGERGS